MKEILRIDGLIVVTDPCTPTDEHTDSLHMMYAEGIPALTTEAIHLLVNGLLLRLERFDRVESVIDITPPENRNKWHRFSILLDDKI